MADVIKSEFELGAYVRESTRASGVPERAKDQNRLRSAARLIVPKLPKRSGSARGRSATARAT
jgi:hypothetical protein